MRCFGDLTKIGNYIPGQHLLSTWFLAIWVHFVLLISVNDLNRHEVPKAPALVPIEVQNYKPENDTPTRRIVIIHVDGLSPMKTFGQVEDHSKLKIVMGSKGSWGVAYSPSNVSPRERMMSTFTGSYHGNGTGFLSDANAVFFIGDEETAQRLKPIGRKFHAFTWSEATWNEYSYKSSDKDADIWVKQQALALLKSRSFPEMHRNKVVLFIRLIGVGMSAELEGESSIRVKDALIRVFSIIDNIINASELLWHDQQSSYLITSDCKSSPIIAWGPMISSALVPDPNPSNVDWKMPYTKRRDLERRSLAPLLSCILDAAPPPESSAALPFDFLKEKTRLKANCAFLTAKQIMHLFEETTRYMERNSYLKIVSFWAPVDIITIRRMNDVLETAYADGDFVGAISAARMLIERCQRGLLYYSEYKRKFCSHVLLFIVTGWMVCCSTWICPKLNVAIAEEPRNQEQRKAIWYCNPKIIFDITMAVATLAIVLVTILDQMSFRFSAYTVSAPIVWWAGMRECEIWVKIYKCTTNSDSISLTSTVYVGFAAASWLLMLNEKLVWSVLLIGSLTFSAFFAMIKTKSSRLKVWLLTSLPFAVVYHHRRSDLANTAETGRLFSACAWIVAVCCICRLIVTKLSDLPILVGNTLVLMVILIKEVAGGGSTSLLHVAWVLPILLPLAGSSNVLMRIVQILFSLTVPFFLLSTFHEPLLLLALFIHITAWYVTEGYPNNENFEVLEAKIIEEEGRTRKFNSDDARRVFFYILYSFLALSAIGITAKVNSMNAEFPDLLEKETFGAVVFWCLKGIIPLLCISCIAVLMWKRCKGDELALALAIMFMFSFMTWIYLLMVFAAGSDNDRLYWSVSHFFLGQYLSLLALLTLPVAYLLTIPSFFTFKTASTNTEADVSGLN